MLGAWKIQEDVAMIPVSSLPSVEEWFSGGGE